MSKRFSLLLASILAFAVSNAFADESLKGHSMADLCPASRTLRMQQEADTDLVIRIPPRVGLSDEALEEVAKERRQCMEWHRKLAGVPKQVWGKMTDAEKDEAVEKAKAARAKDGPQIQPN